jgi:hypothetical protein
MKIFLNNILEHIYNNVYAYISGSKTLKKFFDHLSNFFLGFSVSTVEAEAHITVLPQESFFFHININQRMFLFLIYVLY